jgi:hypothetical protein
MYGTFIVLFTAQATIVFLTAFAEIYMVNPGSSEAVKAPGG